jgi:hypothetical protein
MEFLMRRSGWLTVALFAVVLLPRTAQAQEGTGLKGFIDSLQLGWRPEPHETEPFNQPIAMNGNCILNYYQTDAVILHRSAGSFGGDMDWSVGPRLILGRGMSDRDAFEIGYFAQYQMNGSFFNAGGTPLNFREDYRSTVNSFELNYRHWFLPEFSVLAGFRYINWHEDLNAAFDTTPGSVNAFDHTNNNLFGGQIGGDWKHLFGSGFGIELGGKAGIYGTHSTLDGTLESAGSSRASFVGELGLVGTYNLTNYMKARAGYQVMWVEGIALAPDQAIFLGASSINNRGGVFLHGGVVGLELQW